jgi:hypothetical protein
VGDGVGVFFGAAKASVGAEQASAASARTEKSFFMMKTEVCGVVDSAAAQPGSEPRFACCG